MNPVGMRDFRRSGRVASALALAVAIGGCATLPSSGPNVSQLVKEEKAEAGLLGFEIVDISAESLPTPERSELASNTELQALAREGRVDLLGPGDVLHIKIFEVGVSLFGNTVDMGSEGKSGGAFDASARSQAMEGLTVDGTGHINLPYIGKLKVAGRTTDDVREMVIRGLRGKSQAPQALVSVRESVTNTFVISGLVNTPGRKKLTLARERIIDAVADAGGVKTPAVAKSAILRFTRNGRTVETYLETIGPKSAADLVLLPGDRVEVVQRERSFTVFGATSKVSEVKFESERLSLGEAVARAGGPNEQLADPTGVFVFRYAPNQTPDGNERPIIYRLNMMKPSSYFLAQRFMMHDKDVIYIANARSNQTRKLVEIVNLLVSPFFQARQFSQ